MRRVMPAICLMALAGVLVGGRSSAGNLPVPAMISYQGKLLNSDGTSMEGVYQMQFKLYPAEALGAPLWTSAVANVTVTGGLFSTQLQPIAPSDISEKTDIWLEILVGDPLVALSPRTRLTSSPFALRAGDLTLPFSGTTAGASDTFVIHNTGTGKAGYFLIESAASPSSALVSATNGSGDAFRAFTTGTGRAGFFQVIGGQNLNPALYAASESVGGAIRGYSVTGPAGYFQVDNALGGSDALYAVTNGRGNALYATTSGSGDAVHGYTTGAPMSNAGSFVIANEFNISAAVWASTNGSGEAVYGRTTGAGYAVRAGSTGGGTALYATTSGGSGNAVYGYTSGAGTAGYFQIDNAASNSHALSATTNGSGNGVHATGVNGYGVYARAIGGSGDGMRGFTNGSGDALSANTTGTGWAGYFTASGSAKGVYISAPAGNTGLNVASGTKNAVVATSNGARLLYTEESTEVWFTDYGFGRLENGRATIAIDALFAETVDLSRPYHIFIQPNDPECEGAAVVNKTASGFEVVELRHGRSNAEFSYRLVAKRKQYGTARLEHADWADHDPNLYPEKAASSAQSLAE